MIKALSMVVQMRCHIHSARAHTNVNGSIPSCNGGSSEGGPGGKRSAETHDRKKKSVYLETERDRTSSLAQGCDRYCFVKNGGTANG